MSCTVLLYRTTHVPTSLLYSMYCTVLYWSIARRMFRRHHCTACTAPYWFCAARPKPCAVGTQDEYGGWTDQSSVSDFAAYAGVCFERFGLRVKNWTTFNEPAQFTYGGFLWGLHAPGFPLLGFSSLLSVPKLWFALRVLVFDLSTRAGFSSEGYALCFVYKNCGFLVRLWFLLCLQELWFPHRVLRSPLSTKAVVSFERPASLPLCNLRFRL